METLLSLLKPIVLLPVWALIESPFVRLGARIVIGRRLSFRAAFMLGLITGAALIVASLVLWPVFANVGDTAQRVVSVAAALVLSTALYGYFLTDVEGRSVGYVKGGLVVVLSSFLFVVALLALALVAVGVANVWAT